MNGAEHYREAERLIGLVESGEWVDTALPGGDEHVTASLISAAQVHAALALAAATAMTAAGIPADGDTAHDWRKAIIGTRIRNGAER